MPTKLVNGHKHFFQDEGEGPVLVMLHGAGSSSISLQHHFSDLSANFRIIAPDFRAMGKSDHLSEIPPSSWVDDLAELLKQLSIEKAFIYGVSLGSRVALKFAIDFPEMVSGLVLDAPIIAQDASGNSATAQVFNVDSYSEERKSEMMRLHGEDWENVARNYLNIRNNPDLQEYYNLRESFPSVECPVLITRGDRDDNNHKLIYTYELLKGFKDARLAILPGIGFSAAAGRPEEFRGILLGFLNELQQ